MKYLVSEPTDRHGHQQSDSRVFKSIREALQFIRKSNKNQKVLFGDKEVSEAVLAAILTQRLSSASLTVEGDPPRRLTITVFEEV